MVILFIVTSCNNDNNDESEPIILSENIELYNQDAFYLLFLIFNDQIDQLMILIYLYYFDFL